MAVLRVRLFQVSPAKFKWLGPSPTPQMGSVSAELPSSHGPRLQRAGCAVSVGREIVFCTVRAHSKEKNLKLGEMYICRCLPEGGDYRVCSSGGPLIFLPVPMMQRCGYYLEIMFYGRWTASTSGSVQL